MTKFLQVCAVMLCMAGVAVPAREAPTMSAISCWVRPFSLRRAIKRAAMLMGLTIQIEYPMMCGSVFADQSGPVDSEGNVKILQRHIVNQLVIPTLQERGVDRHHGF
mgnify:CR=1 FL=1